MIVAARPARGACPDRVDGEGRRAPSPCPLPWGERGWEWPPFERRLRRRNPAVGGGVGGGLGPPL